MRFVLTCRTNERRINTAEKEVKSNKYGIFIIIHINEYGNQKTKMTVHFNLHKYTQKRPACLPACLE